MPVCGDGRVAGREQCDPPGALACRSPAGVALPCNRDCTCPACTQDTDCSMDLCTGMKCEQPCVSCDLFPSVCRSLLCAQYPQGRCTQGKQPRTGTSCDDHNACTTQDQCMAGKCVGTGDCDDGNACTDDSCDPATGCVHTPNTAPCDDGNACTTDDHCSGGTCVGGSRVECDDHRDCTPNLCINGVQGCYFPTDACNCKTDADCNDLSPCTADVCVGEVCHRSNVPDGTSCPDDNVCNGEEHCQAGICVGADHGLVCDDGNPCTEDSCDKAAGCVHEARAGQCDDSNACTINDRCQAGSCQGLRVDFDVVVKRLHVSQIKRRCDGRLPQPVKKRLHAAGRKIARAHNATKHGHPTKADALLAEARELLTQRPVVDFERRASSACRSAIEDARGGVDCLGEGQ